MADIANIGSSTVGSTAASLNTSSLRSAGEVAAGRAGSQTIIETARNAPSGAADRVEVSEVARWLEQMNQLPAVREDKVAAARAAIANGSLDTDENLNTALNRLIDDIG